MSSRAPMAPQKIPKTFLLVTGSFRNRAAKIMVTMGRVVVTMLALTGDVRDSPIVKQHWLNTMASIPAKKNISKSRGATSSLCRPRREVSQKHKAAPTARKLTNANPLMPCAMASLPKGDISPQAAQAANIQRWPVRFLSLYIFLEITCIGKTTAKLVLSSQILASFRCFFLWEHLSLLRRR